MTSHVVNICTWPPHVQAKRLSKSGAMLEFPTYAASFGGVVILGRQLRGGVRTEYDISVCDSARRHMRRFPCANYDETAGVSDANGGIRGGGSIKSRNRHYQCRRFRKYPIQTAVNKSPPGRFPHPPHASPQLPPKRQKNRALQKLA